MILGLEREEDHDNEEEDCRCCRNSTRLDVFRLVQTDD